MILISRRKTSPGTSTIREAVNKVTCSRSRLAGSCGRGPRMARRAAQRSLARRPGVPGRGQEPCVCFLRVGDLLAGWDCARSLSSSPPLCFSSWAPLTPLPSLPPLFPLPPPKVASSPSPREVPRLSPPTPPLLPAASGLRTAVWVTCRLFALARPLHPTTWTWVGGDRSARPS